MISQVLMIKKTVEDDTISFDMKMISNPLYFLITKEI